MRLCWTTDIHLNFIDEPSLDRFCQSIVQATPDALLIGGDISEAPRVAEDLVDLAGKTRLPVYFVLGNHDYYHGSIAAVRAKVKDLTRRIANLYWLSELDPIELAPGLTLVGHDGWGDGRLGLGTASSVFLNDFLLIEELQGRWGPRLAEPLAILGDEAAEHLKAALPCALERSEKVIVLTHVPPFAEACWHEGQISDGAWLPYFSCDAVGWVLKEAMGAHPERQMTVLCGHTHGQGQVQILPNLTVLTAGAKYGHPVFQILEI